MLKVTIESTTKKDKEYLPYLIDALCYGLSEEMSIPIVCSKWNGHSGGDDAHFELQDKKIKVVVK